MSTAALNIWRCLATYAGIPGVDSCKLGCLEDVREALTTKYTSLTRQTQPFPPLHFANHSSTVINMRFILSCGVHYDYTLLATPATILLRALG